MTLIDPAIVITDVKTLVNSGFTNAQGYATTTFNRTLVFLDEVQSLAALVANQPNVDVSLTAVDATVTGYVAPTAPVEPDGMSFGDIQTPTAPALPTVTALSVPSMPSAPDATFEFAESGYSTSLLTTVRALLEEWIEGTATGIDPDVEAALWQRGRDREVVTRLAAEDEAMNLFAARGFRKPPGTLSLELQRAAQAAQTQDISASREISVQQAQLEQTNRKNAIDAAVTGEGQLMAYQGGIAQRTFESARFARQLVVDVYRARQEGVATEVSAAAKAKEFEIETQVKLPLEIFKGQVDVYKSQTEAEGARVTALGRVFETRGRIYEAQSKGEADRVDAEVRLYAQLVSVAVEEAKLRLQAAVQNGQITAQKYGVLAELLRTGGTVAAQVAAGALSGVHLSAAMSASGGVSNSYSLGDSHSYEELKQPSVSTTNGTSTSTNYNYSGPI